MDPESVAFQPRDDFWGLQGDMLRVHQTQADLADRVSRLERRHDDDSRLKNVWGSSSPFPSVLTGTPQQVPLQQPTAEHFSNFDDHSSSLIGNLQLDADDEPRRIGATSRANSVRFDETADHGRWAHASRTSLDLIPRTGSGMGGHALSERSYSHKSIGGQSSAGQSVHSATSGRANSFTSAFGVNTAMDPPGLAPGLFILGSVPAIIRCWLTTTFKHNTMLYAAVCSGSYASFLDMRLIDHLGFQDHVTTSEDGTRKIELPVHLPEAIPVTASSRSSSPAPQLPSLRVEFTVVEHHDDENSKAIQVFLGSDMMRANNADILFSSSQLTLYDDDGCKLRIPLVRPEDENTFKSLCTTSGFGTTTQPKAESKQVPSALPNSELVDVAGGATVGRLPLTAARINGTSTRTSSDDGSIGRRSLEQRPYLGLSTGRPESKEPQESSPASASARSGPPPAIWSNWRRDAEKTAPGASAGSLDWANVGKTPAPPSQRRDTGIKVLKPSKPGTRTLSTSISRGSSNASGQSRFFDDGKQRDSSAADEGHAPYLKRSVSGDKAKANALAFGKTPSANPVGGASAFAWLNARGKHWSHRDRAIYHLPFTIHHSLFTVHHSPPAPPSNGCSLSLAGRGRLSSVLSPSSVAGQRREEQSSTPTSTPISTLRSAPSTHTATAAVVLTSTSFSLQAQTRRSPASRRGHRPSARHAPSAWPWSFVGSNGRPASVTTASAKKRKTVSSAPNLVSPADASAVSPSPHEGAGLTSPRSSPLPSATTLGASTSPPRYLPPHLHDEVLEASQEQAIVSRDRTGASSPSEAYANLTLDGEPMAEPDRTRPADARLNPRASSPAKRLHSDMNDGNMDVDAPASARRNSGQSSPRAPKPLPAASQRALRATSVDMADAASNGGSGASSDSTSASNGDSTATSVSATPAADLPNLDEQVGKVLAISQKPLQDRQVGYIVSQKWLERVWARTSQYAGKPHEFSKSATEGEIGPVDNRSLVDPAAPIDDLVDQQGEDFIPLRPGLSIEHDFEVLPAEAWELILSWYGVKDSSPIIRRYVHNTSRNEFADNLQYELYPPMFTIRKVRKTASSTHEPSKKLVASRSDNFVAFIKAAKRSAGIDEKNKIRLWRILNTPTATDTAPQQPSGMLTPEASPPPPPAAAPPLIIDAASLTRLEIGTEREEVTGKDEKANEVYNDELDIAGAGLGEDQVLVLEEHDENGEYVTGALSKGPSKSSTLGVKDGLKANKGSQSTPNSGRSTPALSGPMTRGRSRNGRTRGAIGLTNLGNTCYMNSALQCIRSVEELAIYFLQGMYKREINADNPLGHDGLIAKAYANLMTNIYSEEATITSFAPKGFKAALGRAQPMFSGYGQQDSQEFLSFLVDGLHEDLNRIKKKPYTEYPESDDNTVHDPEAIKALGEKFRDIHRSRNDSVAMDLFNGFYKNTMVCPECDKVSITFDPFSLLTVQLPIEQTWSHTVRYVPLRGKIWDVEVDIDKNATIKALKEYVGKRFSVKGNRLMASEVYNGKYYKHFDDSQTVTEAQIGQRDLVYLYELEDVPSNWPPPKKKYKKSSYSYNSSWNNDSDDDIPDVTHKHHDKVAIPVYNRKPKPSSYTSQQWAVVLWPSYILVDREEARDYDSILRKILTKVEQMTSRSIFSETSDISAQSRSGSDVVLTTEEDASPNGDPRVHDGSVEGEDNLVEVTMTEPGTSAQPSSNDELPEILRPGSFIPPEYRQLFDMKHSRATRDYVTTGWSSVDGNKSYDAISKRVRIPSTRESSAQSFDAASDAESSDEDDVPQFSADAHSSMVSATQSSDEDTQPSIETPQEARADRKKNKKGRKKGSKNYQKHQNNKNLKSNKKGKGQPEHAARSFVDDTEDDDDDRLIKMGEAIILDWTEDAYDALFDGKSADDQRGMDMRKFVETLEDEELQAKRSRRAARQKNGLNLDECFAETSKSEVLSEDNAWYCGRCKELRRATKTLEIWTAPDILVVHLKRFSSHRSFRDKIDAVVNFPIEGLDLSGKVGLPEDKDMMYDLFAVDNHYGGLGGGHYTAFAKNFFDQQWYEYNDSSVSKKSNPGQVVSHAAYLLFYRRRSAAPLGPPALQEIVNSWKNPDYEVEESDDGNSRNPSPAGNGLRLGDLSRNGSSSAFAVGAGALRGGSAGAGNPASSAAGAATLDDDEELGGYPPDEGYVGDEDDTLPGPMNIENLYAPLHDRVGPAWNFSGIGQGTEDVGDVFHDGDAASDAPNMGEDLDSRMMEDFGDDVGSYQPGRASSPVELDGYTTSEVPAIGEDGVTEIRLKEE